MRSGSELSAASFVPSRWPILGSEGDGRWLNIGLPWVLSPEDENASGSSARSTRQRPRAGLEKDFLNGGRLLRAVRRSGCRSPGQELAAPFRLFKTQTPLASFRQEGLLVTGSETAVCNAKAAAAQQGVAADGLVGRYAPSGARS